MFLEFQCQGCGVQLASSGSHASRPWMPAAACTLTHPPTGTPTRVPAQVVEAHSRGQPQIVHHHLLRLRG